MGIFSRKPKAVGARSSESGHDPLEKPLKSSQQLQSSQLTPEHDPIPLQTLTPLPSLPPATAAAAISTTAATVGSKNHQVASSSFSSASAAAPSVRAGSEQNDSKQDAAQVRSTPSRRMSSNSVFGHFGVASISITPRASTAASLADDSTAASVASAMQPAAAPWLAAAWPQQPAAPAKPAQPTTKPAARQVLRTSDSLRFDDDALRAAAVEHWPLGRIAATAAAAVDLTDNDLRRGLFQHTDIVPAQSIAGAQTESRQQQGAHAATAEPHSKLASLVQGVVALPSECNTGVDNSEAAADSSSPATLPEMDIATVLGGIAAQALTALQAAPAAAAGDTPSDPPEPQPSRSGEVILVENHEIC